MIPNKPNQITENPAYTKRELQEIVKFVRLELYNKGLTCGSKVIKKKLDEFYNIEPLPSESTIGRILSQHGLTHGRTGC